MDSLRFLYPYLRRFIGAFWSGLFWLAATNLLGALLPWLLKVAVDAIEAGDHARLGWAALLLALAALVRGASRILSRLRFLHSARLVEVEMRRDLFDRLQQRPAPYFDRQRTGDLLSRFTNDLGNIRMLAGFGVMTLLNTALVYSVTLGFLLWLAPGLTLIALLPYPLMLLLVKVLSRRMLHLSTEVQEGLGKVSEAVEESVTGQSVVRAFDLGASRLAHFVDVNRGYLDKNLELARLRALILPIMTVVGPIGGLLVIYFGGQLVSSGQMTLGELVAFNAYLAQLIWPTLTLGWVLTLTQRCAASMGRLQELLETPPEPVGLPVPASAPAIELRGLCHAYGATPVLEGVELCIPAGALVGIVGPTGSGKSTLLRLLTGLYPLAPGQIMLDGSDLTALDGPQHRRRLAMVPQEGRLFSGSLRDNLLYGVDPTDTARLHAVAAVVQLSAEVQRWPQGYDSRVGEGGLSLSGGQRQRVCLGRALARDGQLWLLDDPLSQLDAATARALWQELRPRLAGRTVLLTSSRVSLLAGADLILVLDNGRAVASGSHAQLLATSPLYARLAEQERLRDELAALAAVEEGG